MTIATRERTLYSNNQLAILHRLRHDRAFWMATCLKVKHQDRGWLPFNLYDWQRLYFEYVKSNRNIVLKSRDLGSSTFFVAYRLHDIIFNPPGNILIAADKMDNAGTLVEMARGFINNLPEWCSIKMTKNNAMELAFGNLWSSITALTGTPQSGRTKRCRHLICTEMAHWRDDITYWTAVTGSLSANGTIDVESTANGDDNLFAMMWQNNIKWGFDRWFFGCWENPDHGQKWFDQKERENTVEMRRQEYPESPEEAFRSVSGSVFGDILHFAHEDAPMPAPYDPDHSYVAWWDLGKHSTKQGRNASVGIVLDVTYDQHFVNEIVCLENAPYGAVQQAIVDQYNRYQPEMYIEVNGPGEPMIDLMPVPCTPFVTTHKSKFQMMNGAKLAIEKGRLKWTPIPEFVRLDMEMKKYIWDDGGIAQDHVMALTGAELCSHSGAGGRVY